MDYAKDYLERLLKMEDLVGRNVEKKLDQMVERKVHQHIQNNAKNKTI